VEVILFGMFVFITRVSTRNVHYGTLEVLEDTVIFIWNPEDQILFQNNFPNANGGINSSVQPNPCEQNRRNKPKWTKFGSLAWPTSFYLLSLLAIWFQAH